MTSTKAKMTSKILLAELQILYDQNRFQDAYHRSIDFWRSGTVVRELSTEEIVLAGRLAGHLGGFRLSRWLFRAAIEREPHNPYVRYFASHLRQRRSNPLKELRELELHPELEGADSKLQGWWLAWQAKVWASFRDFQRAYQCIKRAHSLASNDSWVHCCESDVHGRADRWHEAHASAVRAGEIDPGGPNVLHAIGRTLVHIGRVEEAAHLMAGAANTTHSPAVAAYAGWLQATVAEGLEGDDRQKALLLADQLANKADELAVLADREARVWSAAMHLDIAELSGDHDAIGRWATQLRSPFHRRMLANLRKGRPGARIRLPFRPTVQTHDACLPTSVASALSAMGAEISLDEMVADLTFGGTRETAVARWLEQRGFAVRFFAVTPDVAVRLIQQRIAFVLAFVGEANAHAVAVIGLDERPGTLLLHDPRSVRITSYLLDNVGQGEAPVGPLGMVVVPSEKRGLLNELLPHDAPVMEAALEYRDEIIARGPTAACSIVRDIANRFPTHPGTELLRSSLALDEGRAADATPQLKRLLSDFPASAEVRRRFIQACRDLGNTAVMRNTLQSILEAGRMPGVDSQHKWIFPPACYAAELAELLGESAETHNQSVWLLHSAIRREPGYAPAWHVLGTQHWNAGNSDEALLCCRIASCLESGNDVFASSYCAALARLHRAEEGLAWLETRAHKFGNSAAAVGTWTTWISALESFGQPQRALHACAEALQKHGKVAEMLSFAVAFLAGMGHWAEAEGYLRQLETSKESLPFHQAALHYFRIQGDLEQAVIHAQTWVNSRPYSMRARYVLLELIELRDGTLAACQRAAQWVSEYPGHEGLETAYCELLDRQGNARHKKYSLLLHRLRRNSEDGWAWRELASTYISEYAISDEARQSKLWPRIERALAECDRIAPEHAATARVHASWFEARAEWSLATDAGLNAIEREPQYFYSYRQAWNCCAPLDERRRRDVWEKMNFHLQQLPGALSIARDMSLSLAARFGFDEAWTAASEWQASRPDDPDVLEAVADLLLDYGHGRSDVERAVTLLEPAVGRFPYHLGLSLSLAQAYRNVARRPDAEQVCREALRRHPSHAGASVQLAWILQNDGRPEDALQVLQSAKSRCPRSPELWAAEARIMLAERRRNNACALIEEGLKFTPENVAWRAIAIDLYIQCGQHEGAIDAARRGLELYPKGAYLWFLLGKTLMQAQRPALQREAESALRRSLSLNTSLFASADMLASLLTDQRRFVEAVAVVRAIEPRLADPSPARGRLAWIKRMQGEKQDRSAHIEHDLTQEAVDEMVTVLQNAPWYRFGCDLLLDWLSEDKAWDKALALVATISPALRSDVSFRKRRLALMEEAGLPPEELDTQWNVLLREFPEDVSLHLQRFDGLRAKDRGTESAALLRRIHVVEPENAFIQARLVGLLLWENKKQEALETALRVWFAPQEESTWPAERVFAAFSQIGAADELCTAAIRRVERGDRPTARALKVIAEQILRRGKVQKVQLLPRIRMRFPEPAAREVLRLLEMVDQYSWSNERCRAVLLELLADYGYQDFVIRYSQNHPERVHADFYSWAQTGRALMSRKRRKGVRELMSGWRERSDVKMWALANYVLACSATRRRQLVEVAHTCRDALARLPHDHCARFLAHKQAEAYALLGDQEAFLQTWNTYRDYFGRDLSEGEFFQDKHLLADIPAMAHSLQQNGVAYYREIVRDLRWRRATGGRYPFADMPWWAWLLLLLSLVSIINGFTRANSQ